MSTSNNHPSLELIFDQVKGRVAAQDIQINTLDTKASVGLGSSTILTALTGLQDATFQSGSGSAHNTVVFLLALVALIIYLSIVFCVYMAYKLRSFKAVPVPKQLRDEYLSEAEDVTKKNLVDAMIFAFEKNEKVIASKITWTDRTLKLLLVQALYLVTITFLPFVL